MCSRLHNHIVSIPLCLFGLLATFTEKETDLLASSEVLEVVSTEINPPYNTKFSYHTLCLVSHQVQMSYFTENPTGYLQDFDPMIHKKLERKSMPHKAHCVNRTDTAEQERKDVPEPEVREEPW